MNKKMFGIAILLCIAVASTPGIFRAKALVPATLSLQPAAITGPSPTIDLFKTFSLTLDVSNVANLWSWKAAITWDPRVLNLTSSPAEGSFMGSGTLFLAQPTNYTSGSIPEISDTYLSQTGQSGSGALATFTFKVIGYSATPSVIGISGAIMLDPSWPHNHIAFTTANATFTLPPPMGSSGLGTEVQQEITLPGDTVTYWWTYYATALGYLNTTVTTDTWTGARNLTAWINTTLALGTTPVWGSNYTITVTFGIQWQNGTVTRVSYGANMLNYHPGDISGGPVGPPYYGAGPQTSTFQGIVNIDDANLVLLNWLKPVPAGTDPSSPLFRADIAREPNVNIDSANYILINWLKSWK